MLHVRIAGNAPPAHAENMIDQIDDLLTALDDNVSITAYMNAANHAIMQRYSEGENLPMLHSIDSRTRQRAQLETAHFLIIINPGKQLYKVYDVRSRYPALLDRTAVIFTQADPPQVKKIHPRTTTPPRSAKRAGLNQRRPRR